jgi:hypothetical protein
LRHGRNQIPGPDLADKQILAISTSSATKHVSLDHFDVAPGQAEARNPKLETNSNDQNNFKNLPSHRDTEKEERAYLFLKELQLFSLWPL